MASVTEPVPSTRGARCTAARVPPDGSDTTREATRQPRGPAPRGDGPQQRSTVAPSVVGEYEARYSILQARGIRMRRARDVPAAVTYDRRAARDALLAATEQAGRLRPMHGPASGTDGHTDTPARPHPTASGIGAGRSPRRLMDRLHLVEPEAIGPLRPEAPEVQRHADRAVGSL